MSSDLYKFKLVSYGKSEGLKHAKQFVVNGATKENFELLADFMNEHNLSCSDFLAVVCAKLLGYPQNEVETKLMVAGHEFKIRIEKK